MNVETIDRLMMAHCIDLSKSSGKVGEYAFTVKPAAEPRRHLSRDFGSDGLIQIKFGPVTVGNSIRLASEVELGDALG